MRTGSTYGRMAVVPETSNEQLLAELATALADGVESALPLMGRELRSSTAPSRYFGQADDEIMREARGGRCCGTRRRRASVRALLLSDPDAQWTNPLAIVRTAIGISDRGVAHRGGAAGGA